MKIDYVVPYVDGTKPLWIDQFIKYKSGLTYSDKDEISKRYSPNRLFKYQFRGIERFMPWINTVHLLVSDITQVPSWINRSVVHVVEHKEFIPNDILPIFNSSTLECFLHKIPGLSECFVYSNDDFYILNTVNPTDLFDGVMPIGSFHKRRVNPYKNESYERMNMIITQFICEKLNIKYQPYTFYIQFHVQRAMNKTIFSLIFEQYKTDILQRCTRFREDNNFSQAFFTMYYMCATGLKYKNNHVNYRRFDFFTEYNKMIHFFDNIETTTNLPTFLCLNNNDNATDIAIASRFEKIFPTKSKYEI